MNVSPDMHRAAFLTATAMEQLGDVVRKLGNAAKLLPADSPTKPLLLEAAALAHLAIHSVRGAEHEEAGGRVRKIVTLLRSAAQTLGNERPSALASVNSAVKNLETACCAYDDAHALLLHIDDGRDS